MRSMNKLWTLISILIVMVIALTSCSSNKLASGFDEQIVKQAAKSVIENMNSGNFELITNDMVRDDLKKALSAEVLSGASDQILASAGAFKSYSSEAAVGAKDQKTGDDFATVIIVTQYANKKVTYTISFDMQMKIIGLYMK